MTERLISTKRLEDVRYAFSTLTENQFQCWRDVKLKKLTPMQVAQKRGVSSGTVRSQVLAASAKLEKALRERR